MATTAQLNAVYDAVRIDAIQIVDDVAPSFMRGTAEHEITVNRVLKIARDAVAAYEKTLEKKS